MREDAQAEAQRIVQGAQATIEAERLSAIQSLRAEIGTLSVELAGRVVGESLEDEARQRRTVDRFLEELESRVEEPARESSS
jgi:F-type H+-transporting ATPase subunit b